MTRRGLIGAIAAACVVLNPRPIFAKHVRRSLRHMNRSGLKHTEREVSCDVTPRVLEDEDSFHEMAEALRLEMLKRLREHVQHSGAPINVWRVGEVRAYFSVRTRVSVEHRPYSHYFNELPEESNVI